MRWFGFSGSSTHRPLYPGKEDNSFSIRDHRWPLVVINIGALLLFAIFLNGTLGEWGGDNVDYLLLAESIASGQGYVNLQLAGNPPHTHYPPFYPLLLAPWVGLGLPMIFLKAWTALFSLLGLNAAYFFLVPTCGRRAAFLIISATLCSGAFLDSGFTVMSEGPYFFFSMLALLLVRRSFSPHRFGLVLAGAAGLLIGTAVLTRTVGVAMGPAVACLAFLGPKISLPFRSRFARLIMTGVLSFVVVGGWVFVFAPWGKKAGDKTYALQFDKEYDSLAERPMANLADFAVRLATTPMPEVGKTFGRTAKTVILGFFLTLCLLSAILVVAGFLRGLLRRREIHDFYVFFYAAILFLWIPGGFRLVMPILPFLFLNAYDGIELAVALARRLRQRESAPPSASLPSRTAVVAMSLLIASNLLITFQFPLIRDRLTGHFKPWWRDYMQAVCELGTQVPPGTIVISMPESVPYYLTGLKNTRIPPRLKNPEKMEKILVDSKASYLITTPFQQARFGPVLPQFIEKNPEHFVEVARYGKTRVLRLVWDESDTAPAPITTPPAKQPLSPRCLAYLQ